MAGGLYVKVTTQAKERNDKRKRLTNKLLDVVPNPSIDQVLPLKLEHHYSTHEFVFLEEHHHKWLELLVLECIVPMLLIHDLPAHKAL